MLLLPVALLLTVASLDAGTEPSVSAEPPVDAGTPAPPPPVDKPPSTKSPEQSPAAQRPETTPPQRGFGAVLGVGGITEWGAHPNSMLGVSLGSRFGGPNFSALLEAWTIFPTALIVSDTATLNAFSVGGVVGACGELVVLSGDVVGCALGRGGAVLVEGRNTDPQPHGWMPSFAAGLRLRGEWPRDSLLGFFLSIEGFVPINRLVVQAGETTWRQPWVFGGGIIGLMVRLK